VEFNLKNDPGPETDPDIDEAPGHSPLFWVAAGTAAGLVLVVAAAGAYWVFMRPAPPAPSTVAVAPAPPPADRPAPRPPEPETAAPAPEPPRIERRRRAEPAEPPPPAAPEVALDRGSLEVQSDVAGASVFVNRVFHGQAPLTIPDLPLGSHQVNVSAEGYEGIARSVDITPGANTLSIRFREVTLDAAIPVVHKHRMGSCEGRLVATVDGLRYETSNRADGFSLPFAELGRFEIDYLKKTLRVERRGGRSYEFTDKQPTADPLFVFHRDVDKTRKRLASAPQP
jgi:hypothetical protein